MIRADELELPFVDLADVDVEDEPARVFAPVRPRWLGRSNDGYVVVGHAQARAVLRHPDLHFRLTHVDRETSPYLHDRTRKDIQSMNGPDHLRVRGVAVRALRAHVVDGLRDSMRGILATLLDEITARPACDLVAAFSDRYPVRVVAPILGVPDDDCAQIERWVADTLLVFDVPNFRAQAKQIETAWRALEEYLGGLIEERRRAPGRDIYSELVRAVDESGRLLDSELVMLGHSITKAALDTTRGQLGLTLECLVRHPAQWARLVADPELAPGAVEEGLRYAPAVSGIPHVAAADVEVDGVVFAEGTVVTVFPRAANRDPAVFPDPDRFDIGRQARQHHTFGFGPHACVGASLARAELEEALRALATRVRTLTLDGVVRRQPPSSNGNLLSLPVRIEAAAAA